MMTENRIIAVSPSYQLCFNQPPLTFGNKRINRSHQPYLPVYTSVQLSDPASPPALLNLQHTWAPWNYSGREEQRGAWNNLVLQSRGGGSPPSSPAIETSPSQIRSSLCFLASCRAVWWELTEAAVWIVNWEWNPAPSSPFPPTPVPFYKILWDGEIKYNFFCLAKLESAMQLIIKECCIWVLGAYVSHVLWEECRCTNINLQCPLECLIQLSCLQGVGGKNQELKRGLCPPELLVGYSSLCAQPQQNIFTSVYKNIHSESQNAAVWVSLSCCL